MPWISSSEDQWSKALLILPFAHDALRIAHEAQDCQKQSWVAASCTWGTWICAWGAACQIFFGQILWEYLFWRISRTMVFFYIVVRCLPFWNVWCLHVYMDLVTTLSGHSFYLSQITVPVLFPCFRVLHKEKHALLHSWQMSRLNKELRLLPSCLFYCIFGRCHGWTRYSLRWALTTELTHHTLIIIPKVC
jgi:hypothetical protein